ncbi:hypothetical protein DL93DRAFT_1433745 [Clavulina sp. PMI_390]|nr:hypothetical protein DL93DRAFT_1433745 [Clavulina sp. PMI_390]
MAQIHISQDVSPALRTALQATSRAFCTVGSIPFEQNSPLALFFSNENGGTGKLSLPCASADGIQPLLDACKQAPFGRGSETVLDPAYRRALVLPVHQFSIAPTTAVDPYLSGILDNISHHLLNRSDRRIIAILDKLNVYGPGDFFKGHVDTPRSSDMFGTLLINLPVAHEGGELVVYGPTVVQNSVDENSTASTHAGDKYTTQWGAIDSLNWISFFSDCPHEVSPVTSGYRVTLSFNLRYSDSPVTPITLVTQEAINVLVKALQSETSFSDANPFLGFHLQHYYPCSMNEGQASGVADSLKGSDDVIYHALIQMGASSPSITSSRAIYLKNLLSFTTMENRCWDV